MILDYNKITEEFYNEYNMHKDNYAKKINKYLINCSHSERKFWSIVNGSHGRAHRM